MVSLPALGKGASLSAHVPCKGGGMYGGSEESEAPESSHPLSSLSFLPHSLGE